MFCETSSFQRSFSMTETQITISIENLAPANGTSLTPFWFGLHDGNFDTYDRGRPASPGVERIAEDGTTTAITQEFNQAGFGKVQGVVAGASGPIAPKETARFTVAVSNNDVQNAYFNYAAMLLPSNDFFVANGNERAHRIFDEQGNFLGADFTVLGSNVLDAGTEVNDEIPANTAFFGQQAPNTGVAENGVVTIAKGFIPGGAILSDPRFANGDFTAAGYRVARIRLFNTINGGEGNDQLMGTKQDDLISGNFGNDVLYGLKGNDEVNGGDGDDLLYGGSGNDVLNGGAGFNRLVGGSGNDVFALGTGEGSNTIFGFATVDRLRLVDLKFTDLVIEQNRSSTIIRSGDDQLAVLRNTNASLVTESLFV
jgi:Ca2+-binding RTX toxin-like protein